MIQTEVKPLGSNEYQVHVVVQQGEYDRIYAEQVKALSMQAKLPGFRPGKTPSAVVQKQFGAKLHEDTVSALVQTHYIGAIESSGLIPAVQPMLDVPATQPADGFAFTMKVSTWPEVSLKPVEELAFNTTTVTVDDDDVEKVIERLMVSQVSFDVDAERAAENGDQLHIDFVGSIDGEPFEGGRGEDVALVLGEERFIPGFESQLLGKKSGDSVTIDVTFPEDYQAAHLAGKAASFATEVKSVARPVKPESEDALAKLVGFEDADSLREDARKRLAEEAEQASFIATREAALDALLAAHDMELPEALIQQDIQESTRRIVQNMKQQGMETPEDMLKDEAFIQEVRARSERGLKLSLLLQKVRELSALDVSDAELDAEIERQSLQYPEEQRGSFKAWILEQKEQMASMKDALLERKCVQYVIEKAQTSETTRTLSSWQEEQGQ